MASDGVQKGFSACYLSTGGFSGSVVGGLASDSSNIVSLVREKYDSLIKKVNMTTSGLEAEDGVKVKLRAACDG